MTSAEKSVATAFIDALARGDAETARAMMTDDASWTFPGNFEYSGTHVGKPAIIKQMMEPAGALFADPTTSDTKAVVTVHSVVGQGELVAVEFTSELTTARGEPYRNDYVMIIRIEGDRIAEIREYTDTSYLRATCH